MLDNGSQGCFLRDDLLAEFNVKKTATTISLVTMCGEEKRPCLAVDGFQVSSMSTHHKVTLPKCYSQPTLPGEADEVPTPNKIQKWKYLSKIHSQIPQDNEKIDVQVLIGANCPIAMEPLEVINSVANGPYAMRTRLGWCVTGPIMAKSNQTIRSCLIATKDVITNQPSKHHFAIERFVKEDSCKDLLRKMYNFEFQEDSTRSDVEYSV